jgi:hypothetical protein
MEVSRFSGLVSKPMFVERGVACAVSMRKPLKRLSCAECGVSIGLKAGVNEKNAGTSSLPDALSRLANDRANPLRFAQGSLLLEMQSR